MSNEIQHTPEIKAKQLFKSFAEIIPQCDGTGSFREDEGCKGSFKRNEILMENKTQHTQEPENLICNWRWARQLRSGPDLFHVSTEDGKFICAVPKLYLAQFIASAPSLLKENQELKADVARWRELKEECHHEANKYIEATHILRGELSSAEATVIGYQEINQELKAENEKLKEELLKLVDSRDDSIEDLKLINEELVQALEIISNWNLPDTGRTWDDGTPMSYEAAYGSNGARDYIKSVASQAILKAKAQTT